MDEAEFEPCHGGICGKIHVEATSRSNFEMQKREFGAKCLFFGKGHVFSQRSRENAHQRIQIFVSESRSSILV